jgi:outer membrane lipoprotein SlyB
MRIRSLCLIGAFLFLSACATAPRKPPPSAVVVPSRPVAPAVLCHECGRIERVDMVSNVRATASGGAVLGGVVGGVLSKPATPAATAKPGVQVLTFRIALRMDDGRRLSIHQAQLASGLRAGSRVRVVNGRVVASRPNP